MVELNRFRCWFCKQIMLAEYLSHQVRSGKRIRRCCRFCHDDPESNYGRVYPGGRREERKSVRLFGKTSGVDDISADVEREAGQADGAEGQKGV